MTKETVYLAGPVHHVDDHGVGWRDRVKANFATFEWVDPLDKYNHAEDGREWTDDQIVASDLQLINGCDGLLVGWDDVPSCGTPMEVFYAKRMRDLPVAVRYDGDSLSPWMAAHADVVRPTFARAIGGLFQVFDGRAPYTSFDSNYNADEAIAEIRDLREVQDGD